MLLCDVSGSMEPYTRVYLTLLQGAVAGARAEAFVFATRLTRLTRQLSVRDPDQALARAGRDVVGLGRRHPAGRRASARFVAGHGRRGLARGAVVVVLSDGWAQDDPEEVAEAMRRLRRLAHRVVWVNPRKAAPGYAPLVGGHGRGAARSATRSSAGTASRRSSRWWPRSRRTDPDQGDSWDDGTVDRSPPTSRFCHTRCLAFGRTDGHAEVAMSIGLTSPIVTTIDQIDLRSRSPTSRSAPPAPPSARCPSRREQRAWPRRPQAGRGPARSDAASRRAES